MWCCSRESGSIKKHEASICRLWRVKVVLLSVKVSCSKLGFATRAKDVYGKHVLLRASGQYPASPETFQTLPTAYSCQTIANCAASICPQHSDFLLLSTHVRARATNVMFWIILSIFIRQKRRRLCPTRGLKLKFLCTLWSLWPWYCVAFEIYCCVQWIPMAQSWIQLLSFVKELFRTRFQVYGIWRCFKQNFWWKDSSKGIIGIIIYII